MAGFKGDHIGGRTIPPLKPQYGAGTDHVHETTIGPFLYLVVPIEGILGEKKRSVYILAP